MTIVSGHSEDTGKIRGSGFSSLLTIYYSSSLQYNILKQESTI